MRSIAIIATQAFSLVNFRGPLIRTLSEQGVKVYALAPDFDELMRSQLLELGAQPVDFALSRTSMNPIKDVIATIKLFKLLVKLSPDVTLSYFIKPVIFGSIAAFFARVPKRFSIIEGLGYVFMGDAKTRSLQRSLLRWSVVGIYKYAVGLNHKVFFVNKDDISQFVNEGIVAKNKAVWIDGIGLDLDYFRPAPSVVEPVTFILVARMLREKGVYDFIEAARTVRKRYFKARFLLVGDVDSNPSSIAESELKEWLAEGLIEWPGQVDDVRQWLVNSSVFVLPSYREGLSRSTQEAMAMGLPIITTDQIGCRDTVEDGVNGFLVPVRNPESLAKTMMRFIENPLLIEAMGRAGRRMAVERFDVNSINRQILETMNKKKILFFVSEDWYFCSHRLVIAREAHRQGYEVIVATSVHSHGEQITREGFKLIPLQLQRRSINPLKEFAAIIQLIGIYRREKPDIVHHVAMKPVLYGSMAARLSGVPHVVNALAGMGFVFISNRLKAQLLRPVIRAAFRLLLNRANSCLILQNQDDSTMFIRSEIVSDERIRIIRGSGVDTVMYHPVTEPDGSTVVVLASRMLWDKGVGEFVEAAKLLKKRGVNARFVLVGDADPHNPAAVSMEQLATWHAEGFVECWGRRDDMTEVLSQSHIACLPSYREGLPKSLLEAAASGLPIVTTDTNGCREVVRHGENGFLVPVKSTVELADALQRLIEDPELRRTMGARGREIAVKEFAVEKVVAETMAVCEELLQQ